MKDKNAELDRLRAELADARELLREAIPHLVSNNHWDGAERIQAHLDKAAQCLVTKT